MISIQVVPASGTDAHKALRRKISGKASTWYWADRSKTRLKHVQSTGCIKVANAGGVLVARVMPKKSRDLFYLTEKFMGRLVAWFEDDLAAINVQFVAAPRERAAK
jgi:hypothetical protein